LDVSKLIDGYIRVREGKTQSAADPPPYVKAQGSTPYIKDGAAKKALDISWSLNSGHLSCIQELHRRALRTAGLDTLFYCWLHTFGTKCAESGMGSAKLVTYAETSQLSQRKPIQNP
jgi:hypothetical protein